MVIQLRPQRNVDSGRIAGSLAAVPAALNRNSVKQREIRRFRGAEERWPLWFAADVRGCVAS